MTVDAPESSDIVGYQRKFLLTVTTLVSDNRDAEVPPMNRGKNLVAPELKDSCGTPVQAESLPDDLEGQMS